MKKLFILSLCFLLSLTCVRASLPLTGKTIILDIGHGGDDPGTSYQNILEKDLNLAIGLELEKELSRNGASVILTREGDYDLSSPNAHRRKKSDFDNRIDLINKSKANVYLSIHINYLEDTSYYGGQIFYYGEENKKLAEFLQSEFNTISYPRSIKPMPNIYMYRRLKIPGVLVECGFISNKKEREKLITPAYQKEIAKVLTKVLVNYFT